MTTTVSPLNAYEKGKKYMMTVQFVDPKGGAKITVMDGATGKWFTVEVLGQTVEPIMKLKFKVITLVCTEVTTAGPEFELDAKYFAKAAKPRVGSKLAVKEGLKIEFKSSLLYSPVSSQLSNDQPFEIAKQIAAFMNTVGGDLYLGVNDAGCVTGIESDLPHLEELKMVVGSKTDEKWSYTQTIDGYKRKLTNAVLFYLGGAAQGLLGAFEEIVDEPSKLTYVKIPIKPSEGDVVYIGQYDDVYIRAQASVICLRGRERDQYIKQRFILKGEKSAVAALADYKAENEKLAAELAESEANLAKALEKKDAGGANLIDIYGAKIKLEPDSTFPLDEKFLAGLDKPAALVYKTGKAIRPVSTWGELYAEMLSICADVNPAEFAKLPDVEAFKPKRPRKTTKPNFVRKSDNVRFTKNSVGSGWLGPNRDIRANLTGICKSSFTDPTKLPRRVLAHFGIPVSDIRVWNGK